MGTSDSHLELAGCGKGLERLEKPLEGGGNTSGSLGFSSGNASTEPQCLGICAFTSSILSISKHPVILVSLRY